MKYGARKLSVRKSIKSRTTGKAMRAVKRSINPCYGKKGIGLINNPKGSIYNGVYHRSTFSWSDFFRRLFK